MVVGTRAQVWHGTADRTSGGLKKADLVMKNMVVLSPSVLLVHRQRKIKI